jgi:hypothetical protein
MQLEKKDILKVTMSTDTTSLKQKNYNLLVYIGLLIGINIILSGIVKTGRPVYLDGHFGTDNELKKSTLNTLLFGIPFLGFILGSLISIIPYKNLPYTKKYIYFSVLSIMFLQIIVVILDIRNLILF